MSRTAPALRQTRSSYRTAPLRSHRILRLRQGHFFLALLWFSAHELSREATLARALTALLWTVVWYASIRWTLLRESRAAPSWAFTVVRAAQGALLAGAVILAGNAILGTGDSIASELAAIVAMGTIAFLWQAAVAGHHALGEPLRCVIIGPGRDGADDGDRARRAGRPRLRAGRLGRRPGRAGRARLDAARPASARWTTWSASPTAAASTCS